MVITVLSVDRDTPPETLGTIGASAALSISDIPFDSPVSPTRVGYVDGEFLINPTFTDLERSALDLIVAGTRDAVVMVEAGASEVDEATVLEAVRLGQETNQRVVALQEEMKRELGQPTMEFQEPAPYPPELEARVASLVEGRMKEAVYQTQTLSLLEEEVTARLGEEYPPDQVAAAFEQTQRRVVRGRIVDEGVRPDGRGPKEIRLITSEVGLLPRTHGSGLFTRGQTQVLTITTLGSLSEEQRLDTLSPQEKKRYFHHYNMPGFANGEVRRITGPGRREIGHGVLAERALIPVIPNVEEFPYTLRLVSEVLSSNGSTSMASVCASSLSLMDAGVPIRAPVAGIAMGLIAEGDRVAVLTDIQGMEDHLGDMDFKVAGTTQGVTALQMDIKVKGITSQIMATALEQAREARLFILERMQETITEARPDLSPFAPRILRLTIPVDKIGAVIGPGGKTIRSLIETYKVTVDVENDGTVFIGSPDRDNAQKTADRIRALTEEAKVGEIYTGKVTRIMGFGAFVEILPGKDGLVHISELADHRVASVEDVVNLGDELTVKVIQIDPMGRINLSRRALLVGDDETQTTPPQPWDGERPRSPAGPPSRGPRPESRGGPPRGDRPGGPRGAPPYRR